MLLLSQDEVSSFGIDWNEPTTGEDKNDDKIVLPEVECPIPDDVFEELLQTIEPLAPSTSYGIDIFVATLEFVNTVFTCYAALLPIQLCVGSNRLQSCRSTTIFSSVVKVSVGEGAWVRS